MNNQQPKSSNATPLIIIGLVLLVAIGGGWWFYNSAKTSPVKTNTNSNKPVAVTTPRTSDQPGAQPPNMLGSPTASVTVEEFADFQCPTCAAKYPMVKEIISTYGNRIKFIYRNFPLNIPAHDKAYDAAVAAEAAGAQGRFWDMENQLFTNQQSWTAAEDFRNKILMDYAQKIGLDIEKFKNDMAGMSAKSRVDADLQRGRGMGVSATPSFYINGKPVAFEQMDINSMKQLIDAELAKAPTNPANTQTNAANTATGTNPTNK
jgi:protein-disulfide isomerase